MHNVKSAGIGKITGTTADELILKIADKTISLKSNDHSLQPGDLVRYRVVSEKIFIEKIRSDNSENAYYDTFSSTDKPLSKLSRLIDSAIIAVSETETLSEELKTTLNSINTLLKDVPGLSSNYQIRDILENKTGSFNDIKEKLLQALTDLKKQIPENSPAVDSKQLFEIENPDIAKGYYRFETLKDAQQFLSTISSQAAFQIESAPGLSEPVILKLIPGSGISFGLFLSEDKLNNEFSSLLYNFKSRTLQSIPAEVLKGLLHQRGFLDIEGLNLLDKELGQGQLNLDNKRAGSETAQKAVIGQWLNIALDNKSFLPEIVRLLPVSAASLPDFLHQISSTLKNNYLSQLPDSRIGLTESVMTGITDKKDIIPGLLNNLGINLENSLLRDVPDKKESLKEILLKQINAQLKSQIESFSKHLINSMDFFENATNSEQDDLDIPATLAFLKALSTRLTNTIPELQNTFAPQTFKFLETIKQALVSFQSSLDESLRKLNGFVEQAGASPVDINKKTEILTELSSYIKEFKSSVATAIQVALSKNHSPEPLLAALFKTLPINSGEKIPVPEEQFSNQVKSSEFQKDRIAEVLINGQSSATAATHKTRSLESLLNRVESLQLLAKNTRTGNTEQQILSLPMHINGEWAELHIRMEKRKNPKSGNGEKNISIFLDVSPSGLGNVSARIDYKKNKSFKLQIEFEEEKTRNWFEANNNQIQNALNSLGLPSVMVGFHLKKKERSENNPVIENLSGILDLKV